MSIIPEPLRTGVALATTSGYAWIKAEPKGMDVAMTCHTEDGREDHMLLSGMIFRIKEDTQRLFTMVCSDLMHRAMWKPPVWCAEYFEPFDGRPLSWMDRWMGISNFRMSLRLPYEGWRTYDDVQRDERWATRRKA